MTATWSPGSTCTPPLPPCPMANWSHVEAGKITRIRVTFDARPFPPPGPGVT